ncbi:MAG TPA: hypothetical protein VFW68_06245 [Rhodocyclaceae bacterium]|nr:hypothetical protein [Rhodocyclaceae bacterium]
MTPRLGLLLMCSSLLAACGSMQYTVDDNRPLDEAKLAKIRAYGQGSVALQSAVARAATKSATCEPAWALPFSVATSDQLAEDDRVAWVRVLKADERLTVIAATPDSGLIVGDKLADVAGYHSDLAQRMLETLNEHRDGGRPFRVKTATGRSVNVSPLSVCRGRAVIALPAKPESQSYHWEQITHPLEVFRDELSADESLWIVLWTQGLSEEGGMRMKGYKYGLAPLRALLNVAAVVSGAGAVAKASQSAASNAAGAVLAKSVATSVAMDAAKDQTAAAMSASSKHRASLEGLDWAAGTAFDKADKWAFSRMVELGADPLAAFSLHRKLATRGSVHNAFVLDVERLPALQTLAETLHMGPRVANILSGAKPTTTPAAQTVTPRPDTLAPELMASEMPQSEPRAVSAASAIGDKLSSLLAQPVEAMPQEMAR